MLRVTGNRSTRSIRLARSTRSRAGAAIFEPLENRQLMSAGSIDTSFGTQGQTTPFAMTIADVAVQADNKTVVVGAFGNKFAVGRLNADGQRDTSFGPNHSGFLTTSVGAN